MAWVELGRMAEEDNERDIEKWIGVYIALLAVILAICAMLGGNAAKDATLKNIEASNTWSFFQAKNIRRQAVRFQIEDLELKLAADAGLGDAHRAAINGKIADYRQQDQSLTSDPAKKEGLDELWVKGKALEAERDLAMRKDPYFDYAEALLQIAIVLASVSIISRHRIILLAASLTLGLAGALLTVNGFTLAVAIPYIG
ncbi:MAG: DUF4337 domain-containing protein [Hyphomicrobium sp.]